MLSTEINCFFFLSKITCWVTERYQKGKSSGRTVKVMKLLKITIKIFNWPELLHQFLRPFNTIILDAYFNVNLI